MSALIKVWEIPGGIHPPENKTQSLALPLGSVALPEQLILLLSQHISTPAKPVVTMGEKVLGGQVIAAAEGIFSANVHAPTSGTISAIVEHPVPHASGMSDTCILLDTDGEDRWVALQETPDYHSLERDVLLSKIRETGIAGLGGAGFPAAVKLNPRANHLIDTLIINGTECEPYITADDMLMRLRADEIVAGTQILAHLLRQPKRVVIGVEDNKPEAIAALRQAIQDTDIEVAVFPTKYPSGGEKQLIQILTGREVPSGGLPADIGVLCQNTGTALAVHDAVMLGQPLISRVVTLTGGALERPTNVQALIGTPISELLAFAGLQPERLHRLVLGGPMMGFTVDPQAPIIKTSNCLLAATEQELPTPPPALPCIRCGLCAEACPAQLLPQQLHWFALGKDYPQLQRYNLFDCIECGACAYVCPSSIPLVQYFRAGKAEIRAIEQQHAKAEQYRMRYEQRLERLQREAEQRERDRLARAEKAARAKAAREAREAEEQQAGAATEPDLARVKARIPTLSPEQKQLKIAAATARMALQKAQKQLNANPDNSDLQAQVVQLEQAHAEAQRAFDQATSQEDT